MKISAHPHHISDPPDLMDPYAVIEKYYSDNPRLSRILTEHSEAVAGKALRCLDAHKELNVDRRFVFEAAMLHDIGIFLTDARSIECHGKLPYIAHGLAGKLLLEIEGLPRHARVAARHTGSGLSKEEILRAGLPLPEEDLLPETLEEMAVCYADKFFSKGHVADSETGEISRPEEKPLLKVRGQMEAFGRESLLRFDELHRIFG